MPYYLIQGTGKHMKKNIRKVFNISDPYNIDKSNSSFLAALKEIGEDFYKKSDTYKNIINSYQFQFSDLKSIEDISKIPPIPTAYFKRNNCSIDYSSVIEVTSSGTSGKASRVSYSFFDLFQMLKMSIFIGLKHKLFSLKSTHYVILGYQPTKENQMVISKTAYLSTLYALPISRRYALNYKKGGYQLDLDALIERLVHLSKQKLPVRIVGFPSYTYFLLDEMEKRNQLAILPKGSKILFGGGWKQFSGDEVSKEEMNQKIERVLGIKKEEVLEFFGAAEHPVLYHSCKNHHFHVPTYARIIIRDVKTLEPVDYGEVGLLNLITPVHSSIPLMSILTDDLAVLRKGSECGCGIQSDTVEILGRVGVQDVKTCSAGAKEYLDGGK